MTNSWVMKGTESLSADEKAVIARLLKDNRWRLDRRIPPIPALYLETITEDYMLPQTVPSNGYPNDKRANDDVDPRYVLLPPIPPKETLELSHEGPYPNDHALLHWFKGLGVNKPYQTSTEPMQRPVRVQKVVKDASTRSESSSSQPIEESSTSSESSLMISDESFVFNTVAPLTLPGAHTHQSMLLNWPMSIRLLELLPGKSSTPLSCNFVEVDFTTTKRYAVLKNSGPVTVRSRAVFERTTGTKIPITETLHTTLQTIRKNIKLEPLILWIDSICIYHSCLLEKSRLMARLEDIYSNAFGVIERDKAKLSISVLKLHSLQVGLKSQLCISSIAEISQSTMAEITNHLAHDSRQRLARDFERQPYTYAALTTADSIRVLEILPGEGNAPLLCNLVETRISETRYEALSYAWGTPTLSKWIHEYSSGTTIQITRNLYQALQMFRKPNVSRILWVDAICIDQNSIFERNHQVQQMASIYRQADLVLVWLGRAECSKLMTNLTRLGTEWKHMIGPLPIDQDDDDHPGDDSIDFTLAASNRTIQSLVRDCELAEIGEFLGKSWFRRVWVLQEWLLARDVTIFAGRDSISFELFKHAIDALRHYEHLLPQSRSAHTPELNTRYFRNISTVAEMVDSRQSFPWKIKRSLYQCCRMLINRECTNEHDKIYAVLGLAKDNLSIYPEYERSLAEVSLDMSVKSILAGDFSILHHADTSQQPSFVAQFRNSDGQTRPSPLGGNNIEGFRAGLSRSPCVRQWTSSIIEIAGVRIDEVCFLDALADTMIDISIGRGSPFKPQLFSNYECVKALYCSRPLRQTQDDMGFKLAFWRTMNLGFCPKREEIPYYDRGVGFRFLDLPYRQNIQRSLKNRVFFMTKLGYIGLGPKWMTEQDQVVVFDGAETPFLLRRAAGTTAWRLVGDCYVDGWMDGHYAGHSVRGATVPTGADVVERQAKDEEQSEETKSTKLVLETEFFKLC